MRAGGSRDPGKSDVEAIRPALVDVGATIVHATVPGPGQRETGSLPGTARGVVATGRETGADRTRNRRALGAMGRRADRAASLSDDMPYRWHLGSDITVGVARRPFRCPSPDGERGPRPRGRQREPSPTAVSRDQSNRARHSSNWPSTYSGIATSVPRSSRKVRLGSPRKESQLKLVTMTYRRSESSTFACVRPRRLQ